VHFSTFGMDLAVLGDTRIDDTHAASISLARSPSGYILAYGVPRGVRVQALDASGARRGAARTIPLASAPMLVAREVDSVPRGGPLLAWDEEREVTLGHFTSIRRAAVLADDGAEETPPFTVLEDVFPGIRGWNGSGVFTGTSFLIVQTARKHASGASDGVRIIVVGLDGAVGRARRLGSPDAAWPRIVLGSSEARVVYVEWKSGAAYFARLDAQGGLAGAPVLLLAPARKTTAWPWDGVGAAEAVGRDSLLLLFSGPERKTGLLRLGSTGLALAPPYTIARGPSGYHALALAGRDVAVAWIEGNYEPVRIQLALVRP
jgi:hypothetical protein